MLEEVSVPDRRMWTGATFSAQSATTWGAGGPTVRVGGTVRWTGGHE